MTNSSNNVGQQSPQRKRILPVLIFPGFMSSGLEVKESAISKSWVDKRVWINLTSLGFGSIHLGGALEMNERKKKQSGHDKKAGYSNEMHQEYEKQVDCKNKWLQHMTLLDDMITERPGMKIRAIEGLEGVDYLSPGALTNMLSYVFGPVISALKKEGYSDESLEAASYDWRLPPSELEKRDKFFTNTMRQVEKMYERNDNTPVVLLCHSLGCKTGHYFLNFALDFPNGGTKWLEKYIHTYMPIGAPHLGSANAIRALVDGDKMGLDTFLSEEEGLILGRSLGSGPWLVPRILPNVPNNVFIRSESVLEVQVPPIDCTELLRERQANPPSLRLAVVFRKEVITTEFLSPSKEGSRIIYSFPGTFIFATSLHSNMDDKSMCDVQVILQEPGIKAAKKKEKSVWKSPECCPCRCLVCLLCCPIKYVLCLPCTIIGCIFCATKKITLGVTDVAAKALGAGTNVAIGEVFRLPQNLVEGRRESSEITFHMFHTRDKIWTCKSLRTAIAKATVRWAQSSKPPPVDAQDKIPIATVSISKSGGASTFPNFHHNKKKRVQYEASDGYDLFVNEGLEKVLHLIRNYYETDKFGPRTRSADDAPPVRRVKAIYGVNLPTETSAIYRRRTMFAEESRSVEKLYELDSAARIDKVKINSDSDKMGEYYKLKGGIMLETKETPQEVAGPRSIHGIKKTKPTIIHRSGDGTVPYWSLQHCLSWQGRCDVSVEELDGAPHREILADSRLHECLKRYLVEEGWKDLDIGVTK